MIIYTLFVSIYTVINNVYNDSGLRHSSIRHTQNI